jgi:hypothetical protein
MHILHNYFSRLVVLQKSYIIKERRDEIGKILKEQDPIQWVKAFERRETKWKRGHYSA